MKKIRIGLILLIVTILLLALTSAALAKKPGHKYTCYIHVLVVNKSGEINDQYMLRGDLDAYWDDTTLVNHCTGTIPFGEPISPAFTFASFQDWCASLEDVCDQGVFYWEPEDAGHWVYDPGTDTVYIGDYSSLTIYENDGSFDFYKEYHDIP